MEKHRAASTPKGLGAGGRALWRGIASQHVLSADQLVQLEEACRAKDRLDKLDGLLSGDVSAWATLTEDSPNSQVLVVQIAGALAQANATANMMKQLLAALRLPDVEGKKPQYRGARGAYSPTPVTGKGPGTVSSIERARRRAGA